MSSPDPNIHYKMELEGIEVNCSALEKVTGQARAAEGKLYIT
jgi:hypothetical protein